MTLKSEVMLRARSAFSQMSVAEEEMRRAFRAGDEPDGMFRVLCPRPEFRFWSRSEKVYRAHARELCERAKDRQDLKPATDVECMLALSDMSTRAPLNALGTTLYERLFVNVFGRPVAGEQAREPWPGACNDFLREMRRKLRDTSR